MVLCDTCKHLGNMASWPCEDCLQGDRYERKPMTNADKIKQAGNESEMASAFIDFLCSVPCIGGKCKTPDKTCHQCVLDWLKSEKGDET